MSSHRKASLSRRRMRYRPARRPSPSKIPPSRPHSRRHWSRPQSRHRVPMLHRHRSRRRTRRRPPWMRRRRLRRLLRLRLRQRPRLRPHPHRPRRRARNSRSSITSRRSRARAARRSVSNLKFRFNFNRNINCRFDRDIDARRGRACRTGCGVVADVASRAGAVNFVCAASASAHRRRRHVVAGRGGRHADAARRRRAGRCDGNAGPGGHEDACGTPRRSHAAIGGEQDRRRATRAGARRQLAQERADEKVREAAAAKAARAASANAVAYRARVAQRIHSFQQYPEGARQRGVEGTSTVAFTLNASGAVTTARLAKSGGDAELDGEAIAAVRRASPFPAPPAGVAHTFVAPFSYRLK